MIERVSAWQCIGCGRIEAPQTCIGICQDRKVEFVYAGEHEQAVEFLRQRSSALETLLRQLAGTTPREGRWEASYRAFQDRARALLAARDTEELSAALTESS